MEQWFSSRLLYRVGKEDVWHYGRVVSESEAGEIDALNVQKARGTWSIGVMAVLALGRAHGSPPILFAPGSRAVRVRVRDTLCVRQLAGR